MARPKAKIDNMKGKQSLQKVTHSEEKINNLFKKDRIAIEDIEQLTDEERVRFGELTAEMFNKATPEERDKVQNKVTDIVGKESRTDFWEYNNSRIVQAVSILMRRDGRMPTMADVAKTAGVSRQTVHKHLREFNTSPIYKEQFQKMRILSLDVLTKVFASAMAGDIGSQKLYLNCMGFLNGKGWVQIQNQQNNYIQINNMILSQETIKHLNSEQLFTLENILKSIIPQPEAITMNEIMKQEKITINN